MYVCVCTHIHTLTVVRVRIVYIALLPTDLNYLEETAGGPNLTVATLPKSGKIVLIQVSSVEPVHALLLIFPFL